MKLLTTVTVISALAFAAPAHAGFFKHSQYGLLGQDTVNVGVGVQTGDISVLNGGILNGGVLNGSPILSGNGVLNGNTVVIDDVLNGNASGNAIGNKWTKKTYRSFSW